ncbi:MAG: hypothetical protein SNF68_05365 [Rikenellaceae bacterium]
MSPAGDNFPLERSDETVVVERPYLLYMMGGVYASFVVGFTWRLPS